MKEDTMKEDTMKALIRAGQWDRLPNEPWIHSAWRIWAAACVACVVGGILLTDSGTFWDFFYAFFC